MTEWRVFRFSNSTYEGITESWYLSKPPDEHTQFMINRVVEKAQRDPNSKVPSTYMVDVINEQIYLEDEGYRTCYQNSYEDKGEDDLVTTVKRDTDVFSINESKILETLDFELAENQLVCYMINAFNGNKGKHRIHGTISNGTRIYPYSFRKEWDNTIVADRPSKSYNMADESERQEYIGRSNMHRVRYQIEPGDALQKDSSKSIVDATSPRPSADSTQTKVRGIVNASLFAITLRRFRDGVPNQPLTTVS
ncbi:hypothetical protein GGI12_002004 [Dipsacomyces acuminosporus]|nr:hypothetical protein GGI12_002004 [Dipsacomyces acuminosporus]